LSLEETLSSNLASAVGVAVYPVTKAEKTALPAFTYRRVSSMPRRCHSSIPGLTLARFQIDIFALSYPIVRSLTELAKTFFEVNQTQWPLSYVVNEQETTEDYLFHNILDVMIEYR
jgi:hypothetical protein